MFFLFFFILARTDDVAERTDEKRMGRHLTWQARSQDSALRQIYFTHQPAKKLKETICKGSSERKKERKTALKNLLVTLHQPDC